MYFNNLVHKTFPTSYRINPLNPTVINEYKNGMCNTDNNSNATSVPLNTA